MTKRLSDDSKIISTELSDSFKQPITSRNTQWTKCVTFSTDKTMIQSYLYRWVFKRFFRMRLCSCPLLTFIFILCLRHCIISPTSERFTKRSLFQNLLWQTLWRDFIFPTAATHKKLHKLILDKCKCDKARQTPKYHPDVPKFQVFI